MTNTDNIASFVLRFTQKLWQDTQGEPHVQWRGQIHHVQGGEEYRFTDFAEAVAFIQRYLMQLTLDAVSGDETMSRDKVVQESFKLWEQFASSYTDMMFQAMEQAVKQSEVVREQFDEAQATALKAWQLPLQSDQSSVVEMLNTIQTQLQILSDRVDNLETAMKQQSTQTGSENIN